MMKRPARVQCRVGFVEFVAGFPGTETGKVQRLVLRDAPSAAISQSRTAAGSKPR